MQPYTETITVKYHQTDGKGTLSTTALLEILQDAAINHADTLGYSLEYMAQRKQGWAVIHWHIVLLQQPVHGETIHIQTWTNKCRKIQAERSYTVTNNQGDIIAKAISRWVLMDFAKRTITSVPDHMIAKYASDQPPALANETYKIPKEPTGTLVAQRQFVVTRCDTDTNGHTNNVKYLAWAMDDMPDNLYENMTPYDIRVVYRKECSHHDTVQTKTYLQQQENIQTTLTLITDTENTILCEIQMLWQ